MKECGVRLSELEQLRDIIAVLPVIRIDDDDITAEITVVGAFTVSSWQAKLIRDIIENAEKAGRDDELTTPPH